MSLRTISHSCFRAAVITAFGPRKIGALSSVSALKQ
jgi:hypothetical protein